MFSSFFLFRGKSGRRKSIGDNFVITRIDCQSAIKPVGSSRKYRWKISGTRSPWIKYSWVRRTNSIWNFHRWIKIKRTFCYSVRITFNLSRALLDNRRWKFIFQGKGYEMKVFVCKKKKICTQRRESNIEFLRCEKFLKKGRGKRECKCLERLKVKKNEDHSKVRVAQRSVCRVKIIFKVRTRHIIGNNALPNIVLFIF